MIVDVVTYNGEEELFEIRYNILKDFVDEFIVIEFSKTFSGTRKKPTFPTKKYPDVKHFYIKESQYNDCMALALSSPNTKGADHWKREFCQKESIKDCLNHLKDRDIVFIGDCDEIWDSKVLSSYEELPTMKLRLKVYTYYLNNRSSEHFSGTLVSKWGNIKDKCLNHERSNRHYWTLKDYGWHFTSMHNQLAKKLKDSYTKETYANDIVMAKLEENIKSNRDFLGRDFTYQVDESEWPEYLKNNREKYQHLLK